MNANYWEAQLAKFEQQPTLHEPHSLQQRMKILKSIDELMRFGKTRYGIREGFRSLLPRATALQKQIEDTNTSLFDELRSGIRDQQLCNTNLRSLLDGYTPYRTIESDFKHFGDALNRSGLDALINGIFQTENAPEPSLDAVAEMIHLEMTPMSVVLELVDRMSVTPSDTFVDIGSGQGQICLLTHLLTGVQALGIDIEPTYVNRARDVATYILGDPADVSFAVSDARFADYSRGTIFFLYTPFIGQVFRDVMAQLRQSILTHPRKIKICSYGDITLEIEQLPWLHVCQVSDLHPFRLAIFENEP